MEVDSHSRHKGRVGEVSALKDASDPEVLEKYKCAGLITNKVLTEVLKNCLPGSRVVDLCQLGDVMIEAECAKVYPDLKIQGQKGIAFPCCVAVNEVAGHCSPLSSDVRTIKLGDVIKVDCGAHIDGFAAVAAHTIVLGECSGKIADCMAAAWTGSQAALRLLKVGNKSTQITLATTKAGESFQCEPMEAVLSHEMKQYVLDYDNTILLKETEEHKCEEFEFTDAMVLGIDVMMSTGRGRAVDRGDKCTVFKRNVEIEHWSLKLKAAHDMIRMVNKNYPTFPFTLRAFEKDRCRYGVTECVRHSLLQPYPVLSEREREFVCQFKFTAIVSAEHGVIQVSGLPLDMSVVLPSKQVSDKALNMLLSQTITGKQPLLYEHVPMPDLTQLVPEPGLSRKSRSSGSGGRSRQSTRTGRPGKRKGGRPKGKKPQGRGGASKRSGGPAPQSAAKGMDLD